MIGVLLLGFWKLQVIDSDKYDTLAERNRVREIPIIAPRGRMLDRDGRVLVDNRPSFSVLLLREDMSQVEKHLGAISDGLGIPMADLEEQLNNTKDLPHFEPIIIKRSEEHTSELQSRLHLVCRLLLEKKKQQHATAQP